MPKARPAESALLREDTLTVEVDVELIEDVPDFDLAIYLTSNRGVRVVDEALRDRERPRLAPGRYRVCMDVPPVLNVGDYSVGLR
jgi:ABC-2 type transport system ATP-binding protein/lipopolysaccharide transport system ATP-binding protein